MSSLLQTSLDGKRFHGRWNESIGHCISAMEFDAELRRINCEMARHMNGRGSTAKLAYAVPFICIPFGILLIVLSLQAEKWPFVVAGVVLAASGAIGTCLFSSFLGVVLVFSGTALSIVPFADKTPWVCITIATMLSIMGCVGLMALALPDNRQLRSSRILVVLLPIAIAFFCIPFGSFEYPVVMVCIGIVLILAGMAGALEAALARSRRLDRCLADLRIVVDQLNSRYASRLMWTLIERSDQPRGDFDRSIEILIEASPSQKQSSPRKNDQQPVINVVVQTGQQTPTVTPRGTRGI